MINKKRADFLMINVKKTVYLFKVVFPNMSKENDSQLLLFVVCAGCGEGCVSL